MSLKEKMTKINKGITFMDDRTKGETEELIGKVVTITDYDFINGVNGDYVVFIVKEIPDSFYFGGMVLTDNLKELTADEKKELQEKGLPCKFTMVKSKETKRTYTNCEFYPEA